MKNVRKTTSSISIALLIISALFAAMFLSSLLIAPVAAADIISTPIGETINVTSGETFVLPFKMRFDNTSIPADDGFFSITFYWDVNHSDPTGEDWNFTYESFVCKFTDGTNFTEWWNVTAQVDKDVPSGFPAEYYRYTVQVYESYGEPRGTSVLPEDFWVNVTMRAAGQGGSYINHTAGEQNITIVNARCYEDNTVESGEGNVTINVTPIPGVDAACVAVKTYSTKHGTPGNPYTPVLECYMTWQVKIDVTVKNNGTGTRTFTVWAYAGNATGNYTIGSASVTLGPQENTTRTFTWNVPDLTKKTCTKNWLYTIYGNATLADDTRPENNVKIANNVKVKWYGDGSGDGKVGLPDLMILAQSYVPGTPGAPNYNPQADYSGDGPVGLPDLMILAQNYGKGPCD